MESLISSLVLPVSQELVGLCLCLRRKRIIDVTRVDQDTCFGSTLRQTFEVGWNLKTRRMGYCSRSDLSLDGQLKDVLRSKAIARRSDGGNVLFFQCFEDCSQRRPGFVVRVLGDPGIKLEVGWTDLRKRIIVEYVWNVSLMWRW